MNEQISSKYILTHIQDDIYFIENQEGNPFFQVENNSLKVGTVIEFDGSKFVCDCVYHDDPLVQKPTWKKIK